MANDTFSGVRALFSISSIPRGYARTFSGREAYSYDARHVLGILQCVENVVVSYAADCTATFFRLIGKDMVSEGIMPTVEDVLTSGELTCAVTDKLSNKTPYFFTGVKPADNSFSVDAGSLVNETQSFVAIRRFSEGSIPLAA